MNWKFLKKVKKDDVEYFVYENDTHWKVGRVKLIDNEYDIKFYDTICKDYSFEMLLI